MFDRYHIVTPDRLKANAEKLEAAFREKDAALEQSNQGVRLSPGLTQTVKSVSTVR